MLLKKEFLSINKIFIPLLLILILFPLFLYLFICLPLSMVIRKDMIMRRAIEIFSIIHIAIDVVAASVAAVVVHC